MLPYSSDTRCKKTRVTGNHSEIDTELPFEISDALQVLLRGRLHIVHKQASDQPLRFAFL
jgi:hypothetical protein